MIAQLDLLFRSLAPRDRGLVYGTLLAGALYLVHVVLYSTWFIEDAAITFAFADHIASGWGPVAYPGGERVEGFSNPTWTLALAGLSLVGISPFIAAKLLGAACGLGALVLSTVWARELIAEERRHYALIAPFFLAVSPSFAMWSVGGLENAMLSVLVAGASIRGLGEVRERAIPVSGLLWAMVAITRPEAPLYAAIGGLVTGAAVLRARGVGGAAAYTAGWLMLFAAPFGLWHGWRYWTFAWELPNTYYAKVGDKAFQPWGWGVRGWLYLRSWALITGQGFLAPLYVMGQSGVRGRRGAVAATLAVLGFALVLPGVSWFQDLPLTPGRPEPEWLISARVVYLGAAAALIPLIGVGRKDDDARILAWYLMAAALFFGLYSGGDWMSGFRWPSLMVVPMAVLLADAVAQLVVALAPGPWFAKRVGLAMTVGLACVLGIVQTIGLLTKLETSPYDVYVRVGYMREVADKLGLERPSAGEIDMGAHLWWSGFELTDLAGLLDVPIGHHQWETAFMQEYVIEERRPDFMHVHSFWATRTHLNSMGGFSQRWAEIPPYPSGSKNQHAGNHVRRDLLTGETWEGPKLGARLGTLAVIEGLAVRSEQVAPGTDAVIELAVRKPRPHSEVRLTLFAFVDGEVIASADAPILWDWLWQGDLRASEITRTRIRLPLPEDAPSGEVQLGLAAWTKGPKARALTNDRPVDAPVFATHELHVGTLTIAPESEVAAAAVAALAEVVSDAEAGRCEAADAGAAAVRDMRRGAPEDWEPAVREADGVRARCWARWAETRGEIARMHWALRLDPGDAEVLATGVRMADALEEQARVALEAEDIDRAYESLRDALIADPTRAWTRRRAEDLRDRRLGLGAYSEDSAP